MTGRWFSPGPPVPSTNKTDRHDITVIQKNVVLKVVLSTINLLYTELQDTSEIIKKNTVFMDKTIKKFYKYTFFK